MNSYQEKISERRRAEAVLLWSSMSKEGFSDSSIAALDFTFFSNVKNDAESLAKLLGENYSVEIVPATQEGYWLIKATTRPYGKSINQPSWMAWVEYMVMIGFSNNCVFSTWSVFESESQKTWSSESINVE